MRFLTIILISTFLFACKKHSTTSFTVQGQINDSKSGIGVGNVTLKVYEVVNFGANAGVHLIGNGTSNSDGSYEITFDRNLVESYIFTYAKEGYFTEEVEKSFDDLKTGEENIINVAHRPIGWIRFVIQNIGQTDPGDQIKIYKESGTEFCPDCCADGYYYFDGANVDTTWTCPNIAGEYFVFHYWDLLQPSYGYDSVLIQQNDTIDYVIQY